MERAKAAKKSVTKRAMKRAKRATKHEKQREKGCGRQRKEKTRARKRARPRQKASRKERRPWRNWNKKLSPQDQACTPTDEGGSDYIAHPHQYAYDHDRQDGQPRAGKSNKPTKKRRHQVLLTTAKEAEGAGAISAATGAVDITISSDSGDDAPDATGALAAGTPTVKTEVFLRINGGSPT